MQIEFDREMAGLVLLGGTGKVFTRSGREVQITTLYGHKRNRPIEGRIRIGKESWSTKKYWNEKGEINGGAVHNHDLLIEVEDDEFWN